MGEFLSNRGPIQLISANLHGQLERDLDPQISGYVVHTRARDIRDEVGPFSERSLPVRYLLDQIVSQSKGASWIATPWGEIGNLKLAMNRQPWTIAQYDDTSVQFGDILRSIAAQLPSPVQ
jgi:hypothetical protein